MNSRVKNILMLMGFLFLWGIKSYAAEEPYENFIKGTLKKNDSLFVKDEKFNNPAFTWSDITNISVKNTLTLTILNEREIPRSFHLGVTLKVMYYSNPTQDVPTIIDSVRLNVDYQKGDGNQYKVSDHYQFADGYYVKVYVTEIKSEELGEDLPEIFQLSSSIVIDRKYKFIPLMPIAIAGNFVSGGAGGGGVQQRLSTGGTINSSTQLQLSWDPLPSGEEYDLEWVTLDKTPDNTSMLDALVANTYSGTDSEIAKFFRNNSTRVTVTVPSYLISLMYNSSVILVRVRQVHYTIDGLREEGVWSYKQDNPVMYTAWSLAWHESKMNWQYAASFAEEGKKKEVVTYFDGSLRGRQTVTLNNAENVAVVQENIYDQFGRVTANILPAPIKEAATFQNLHYFQKFNKDSTTNQYSYKNLNIAIATNVAHEIVPQTLNVSSGASFYYSEGNVNTSRAYTKYIPNAAGLPISVTQYTEDNTGRIKVQGGVGPAFQPGIADSRTTKYYYGKPEQWELDRVFGNDVGFADHYLKNMVIDPNKQISVSYLNSSGKTVATALAGANPSNMDALSSMPTALTDTIQLINSGKFTYNSTQLTLSANTTHLAAVTGPVKLKYNIEQLISRYPGGAFQPCSNCYYELTIKVTDDFQTKVFSDTTVVKIGSAIADPSKTSGFEGFLDLNFSRIGEYNINFEFKLSNQVIKYFTDEFVRLGQAGGAVKKEQDFILNELNQSLDNFNNCLADCKTAVEKVGTLPDFQKMFNTKLKELGVDSSSYQSYITGLHATLMSTAQALQATCGTSTNACDQYKLPMLEDVSPGGQYALFTAAGAPLETDLNVLNLNFRTVFPVKSSTDPFYQSSLIILESGKVTSPHDSGFALADLVKYWKPEWASLFLSYHPEYCKLLFCQNNSVSANWAERLLQTSTAAGVPAVTSGSLNYSDSNSAWLLAADPFFASGAAGNSFSSAMSDDLLQYSSRILKLNERISSASIKGLSQYVDYQLYCADSTANTNASGSTSSTIRWTNCTKLAGCRVIDREWQLYRDLYLELRQKYFELARTASCSGSCDVGNVLTLPVAGSTNPGCGNGLGLGSYGAQISPNKFLMFDYSSNAKTTFTLIQGVADIQPLAPDSCSYTAPVFYSCLTVSLPDGQTRNFFNVWVFRCVQRIVSNCDEEETFLYANANPTSNEFTVIGSNPSTVRVYQGYGSSTQPTFPYCSSYHSSAFFSSCYSVLLPSGSVYFYNNVWVHTCYVNPGYNTRVAPGNTKSDTLSVSKLDSGDELMEDIGSGKTYSIIRQSTLSKNSTPLAKANFSSYEFRPYFIVQLESNSFLQLKNVWVAQADSNINEAQRTLVTQQSQNLVAGCSTLLPSKQPRFISVNYTGTVTQPAGQVYNNLQADLFNSIKNSCDSNAVVWMERLSAGLTAAGATQAQKDFLKAKLISICTAGGDVTHPFGASSLPGNQYLLVNGVECHNFGEVIKALFGMTSYNNLLNPWLIDAPYPFSPAHISTERVISNSSNSICSKLSALRLAGQTDLQFYDNLKVQYGPAMKMTWADFQVLLTGCVNCRFLLAKDLILPLFLEENTTACITKTEYTAAIAEMNATFNNTLNSASLNYESIVSNYLNFKWGFSLPFERYKSFEAGNDIKLCNEAPYADIAGDPYSCQKSVIEFAIGKGKMQYQAYLTEERRKFEVAYLSTCSAAQANVRLLMPQQVYHYTLYYYDQAGNLVRTVPPEGVNILSKTETLLIDKARNYNPANCNYSGPATEANKPIALQGLSNTLAYSGNAAVELWLYQNSNSSRQMMVSTPDLKYMFQACIYGNLLNVDVYSLQPVTGGVSIVLSNHVTANISAINPIMPWTHVVVQGNNLASGALQLWVNGKQYTPIAGAPSAGCSWSISTSPSLVMPENIGALKHLRVYSGRLMTAQEIKANAESGCFAAFNSASMAWYRFNLPVAGSATTIAVNSTVETQFKAIYPAHNLATTYAYNSTGQVIRQQSPDGGTSRFWYDLLGRLVVSQNAKQASANNYSYTKYDLLGRIMEVGEKTVVDPVLQSAGQLNTPGYLDDTFYTAFLSSGTNAQLTQTTYDTAPAVDGVPPGIVQNNLRKRVSASIFRESPTATNINATYYDYDLSGNVKTLYQQVSGLGLKKIDYEYDLASGKVNFVSYQHQNNDAFYYNYKYDAENRLTEAWSAVKASVSPYGIGSSLEIATKKMDASYTYYLHGPLARMELGDAGAKAQGVDYAYTLQGWLKGVNGKALLATSDQGGDGTTVGRDAVVYSLGYFPGDYSAIGGSGAAAYNLQWQVGGATGAGLYNGNISISTVAIKGIGSNNPSGYSYGYDQLNRLTRMRQHNLPATTTSWNSTSINNKYSENYSYDANGNILTLQRNGPTANTLMDNLTYGYNKDASGRLVNNKLSQLTDVVAGVPNTGELNGQSNYTYDNIGNLISDSKEGITGINWSVYGKIRSITKSSGNISYSYDPSGNRVSKTSGGVTTWYVRDAQGNTLGVYDNLNGVVNWREQQLYGSSRLGMWRPEFNISAAAGVANWALANKKNYELTNHLGNVLAVITETTTLTAGLQEPTMVSAQDYYPFGMVQPGRTANVQNYRYGFNGKENDNEVKGTGGQQDYGMRIYDPRIGKFLSVDPLSREYAELTPYQFASNTPIAAIDRDGLESAVMIIPRNANVNTSEVLKGYHEANKKAVLGIFTASDVNDATVLTTWMTRGGKAINVDGSPATNWDKGLAAGGILLPVVSGSAIKQTVKWGSRGVEWLKYAGIGEKVADAVIGGSSALRKALIKSGAEMFGKEAHHIIPTELLKTNDVVQDAVNAGFDFNGTTNGLGLSAYRVVEQAGEHANHPQYTQRVLNEINNWAGKAKSNGTYSPESAKKFLDKFSEGLKKTINENKGKKINDLRF